MMDDDDDIEANLADFLEETVGKADRTLTSEVKEVALKRRSKLIVCNTSSESSKKSCDFGSSTLSSVMGISSDCNEENSSSRMENTNIEDVEMPSFGDMSEELLYISSESSGNSNDEAEISVKNEATLGTNMSTNTLGMTADRLCNEAKNVIVELGRTNNGHFVSSDKCVTILDLEAFKDHLTDYSYSVWDTSDDSKEHPGTDVTTGFILRDAKKVLDALEAGETESFNRMTILDLEHLSDCLIPSPSKENLGERYNIPDATILHVSTPKTVKRNRWPPHHVIEPLNGISGEVVDVQGAQRANLLANSTFEIEVPQCNKKNFNTRFQSKENQLNMTFDAKLKHNAKGNLNSTFKKEELFNASNKENINDKEMHHPWNLNGTFILNASFDTEKDNKNDDIELENKNLDETFKVVGNGTFMVEGKETNLMDMEKGQLLKVLHLTPSSKASQENAYHTPISRKKRKFPLLNHVKLAGNSTPKREESGLLSNKGGKIELQEGNEDPVSRGEGSHILHKNKGPLGRDEFLNKLRKTATLPGNQGPVRAIPLKLSEVPFGEMQSPAEPSRKCSFRSRAVSTPIGGDDNSGLSGKSQGNSDSDDKRGRKVPSLPSFGSVSSIDERPNMFDVNNDCSPFSPEVFREQPPITSTPALKMDGSISRLEDNLRGCDIPTPIRAPKKRGGSYKTPSGTNSHNERINLPCNDTLNLHHVEERRVSLQNSQESNEKSIVKNSKGSNHESTEKSSLKNCGEVLNQVGDDRDNCREVLNQVGDDRENCGEVLNQVGDDRENCGEVLNQVGDDRENCGEVLNQVGDDRENCGEVLNQVGDDRENCGEVLNQVGDNRDNCGEVLSQLGNDRENTSGEFLAFTKEINVKPVAFHDTLLPSNVDNTEDLAKIRVVTEDMHNHAILYPESALNAEGCSQLYSAEVKDFDEVKNILQIPIAGVTTTDFGTSERDNVKVSENCEDKGREIIGAVREDEYESEKNEKVVCNVTVECNTLVLENPIKEEISKVVQNGTYNNLEKIESTETEKDNTTESTVCKIALSFGNCSKNDNGVQKNLVNDVVKHNDQLENNVSGEKCTEKQTMTATVLNSEKCSEDVESDNHMEVPNDKNDAILSQKASKSVTTNAEPSGTCRIKVTNPPKNIVSKFKTRNLLPSSVRETGNKAESTLSTCRNENIKTVVSNTPSLHPKSTLKLTKTTTSVNHNAKKVSKPLPKKSEILLPPKNGRIHNFPDVKKSKTATSTVVPQIAVIAPSLQGCRPRLSLGSSKIPSISFSSNYISSNSQPTMQSGSRLGVESGSDYKLSSHNLRRGSLNFKSSLPVRKEIRGNNPSQGRSSLRMKSSVGNQK